jgi:hypothetical protein
VGKSGDRSQRSFNKNFPQNLVLVGKRRNEELQKCQILCQKCHLNKTIEENTKPPDHGTTARYWNPNYKCRCEDCQFAVAEHQRLRRIRIGGRIGSIFNKN